MDKKSQHDELQRLFFNSSLCSACEGAGYQSPPMLGVGNFDAEVLVIAQNPGRIKSEDKERLGKAESAKADVEVAKLEEFTTSEEVNWLAHRISSWYAQDFGTSFAAHTLQRVLGATWLESGKFFYTNATRCRTLNNARPTEQMVTNCGLKWTNPLLAKNNFKAVITIGRIAANAVAAWAGNWEDASYGSIYPIFQGFTVDMTFLPIAHYRVWRPLKISLYRSAVAKLLSDAKIDYTVT